MIVDFDDYLRSNVDRRSDRAIRESDLYTSLKLYCKRGGYSYPSWQQFHKLLKERHANKQIIDRKMMIVGIVWKNDAGDRPADVLDYILSEPVVTEEPAVISERDNE